MFGLGKHGPDGRYGVVVDVGSGSVGIAVVASDPLEQLPTIVWSYRERTAIKDIDSLDHSAKDISTALVNAFLTLGAKGFKTLREYDSKARVRDIQVNISAPWSYTISKSISVKGDEPFEITKSLIRDLIDRAQKEAIALIDTNQVMDKLGLEVINSATISIEANDYPVPDPYGQKANKVTVTHVNGISQKKLLEVISETADKILPKAEVATSTFMYAYYQTLSNLYPDTAEICMLDVTAEAVELGIVRDGILRYVTHMPYGRYTIAREIAQLCNIPKEEAFAYMSTSDVNVADTLSKAKTDELHAIISAFEEKLTDLFTRTGDTLSIPKTLFVHTDTATEDFFRQRIINATNAAFRADHAIHFITSKIFEEPKNTDTAILLSAYVFHKNLLTNTYD